MWQTGEGGDGAEWHDVETGFSSNLSGTVQTSEEPYAVGEGGLLVADRGDGWEIIAEILDLLQALGRRRRTRLRWSVLVTQRRRLVFDSRISSTREALSSPAAALGKVTGSVARKGFAAVDRQAFFQPRKKPAEKPAEIESVERIVCTQDGGAPDAAS